MPKIDVSHIQFIRGLRRRATEFSLNKNLSASHRAECRREAAMLLDIELYLEQNA